MTDPVTDHTHEYVPILISGAPVRAGVNIGVRSTFTDLATTIADALGVKSPPRGTSFKSTFI